MKDIQITNELIELFKNGDLISARNMEELLMLADGELDNKIDIERAQERYANLDDSSRNLLRLLSLASFALSIRSIQNIVKFGKLEDLIAGTQKDIKKILENLNHLNLVEKEDWEVKYLCDNLISKIALRDLIRSANFARFDKAVSRVLGDAESFDIYRGSLKREAIAAYERALRLAIYQGDDETVWRVGKTLQAAELLVVDIDEYVSIELDAPFEVEWLKNLSSELQSLVLFWMLRRRLYLLQDPEIVLELANAQWYSNKEPNTLLGQILSVTTLMRGTFHAFEQQLTKQEFFSWRASKAILNLQQTEDLDVALQAFAEALKSLRSETGQRKAYFHGIAGVFYVMALLGRGGSKDLELAQQYCDKAENINENFLRTYHILNEYADLLMGRISQRQSLPKMLIVKDVSEIDLNLAMLLWIDLTIAYWNNEKINEKVKEKLIKTADICAKNGYDWLAWQFRASLDRVGDAEFFLYNHKAENKYKAFVDFRKPQEKWRRTLDSLSLIARGQQQKSQTGQSRLVWLIKIEDNCLDIEAREQRPKRKGRGYTKGRLISAKSLYEKNGKLDYLRDADLRVISGISKRRSHYYYSNMEYTFGPESGQALVGHPLVFWQDQPEQRVDVIAGHPQILVQHKKAGAVELRFDPDQYSQYEGCYLRKNSETEVEIFTLDENQQEIQSLLQDGLVVPAEGQEAVLDALSASASVVDLRSDEILQLENIESLDADERPRARLAFVEGGLQMELVVRPLGDFGPVFPPAHGPVQVVATKSGEAFQCQRDLHEEEQKLVRVLSACKALQGRDDENRAADPFARALAQAQDAGRGAENGALRWLIEDPELSLELLSELRTLDDEVKLEWTGDKTLKVRYTASTRQLKLNIGSGQDWFALSGELQIDQDRVIEMSKLMALTKNLPGRFVPLEDGEFLALSQSLKDQLDALRRLSQRQGKNMRVHALAAPALDSIASKAGEFDQDEAFHARVVEMERLLGVEPKIPAGLNVELRDYQREGYKWLARLSAGGLGACLADDMGLGKTVQVLSLLLARAEDGPSLVIAPTSVVGNWHRQAEQFTPKLKLVNLREGDRSKKIAELGPGDVLLSSYALIVRESSELSEKDFNIIVLDEAQAIKNAGTKRWGAVKKLKARQRLVTTGTPVENHLDELWALFAFINPGLLGSRLFFNSNFALPIERDKDKAALKQLKTLIAPYVLRRSKSEVLQELPPRTEIVDSVVLSEGERAHYEALRQNALEQLSELNAVKAGPGHLKILAEITRLRRACANPNLVSPNCGLVSSKLDAAETLLVELRDAGHKVLVFSQWIDQLHALRQRLQNRQLRLMYLDGATPEAQRRKNIDAFQEGEADVFLISLKAGGQGINLTAADYVVHLDPWWNPAVEDQASDRAHRIGQTRPVTVYRLIVKDSIEEQIVAMHKEKRDLASQILAGGELSAKLSAEALLDMIRQSGTSG